MPEGSIDDSGVDITDEIEVDKSEVKLFSIEELVPSDTPLTVPYLEIFRTNELEYVPYLSPYNVGVSSSDSSDESSSDTSTDESSESDTGTDGSDTTTGGSSGGSSYRGGVQTVGRKGSINQGRSRSAIRGSGKAGGVGGKGGVSYSSG